MNIDMEAAIAASTLERLDALRNWERGPRSRMEPTIAPMRDLMSRLGNPHRSFKAIHVTGTKGKGSVCSLLEAALHDAGIRAGRYSSPHVDSICERVSLRRKPVAEDRLLKALEEVLDVRDQATLAGTAGRAATWFDVMTAAAFAIFAREKLDWAVVEVGLGGRLDSTNVVDGTVCIVTNIGLEHTDVLGSTEAEIAREKAGIVKTGSHVVTGTLAQTEAGRVIRERAAEVGAPLFDVAPATGITATNLAIARAALDCLGRIGVAAPRGGAPLRGEILDAPLAKSARLPGRMERWSLPAGRGTIPLLIDGAHVDIAVAALLDEAHAVEELRGAPVCLMAFSRDKQPRRMLAVLRGRVRHVLFTRMDNREGWEPEDLLAIGAELGISCSVAQDPRMGMEACMLLSKDSGWVLATGSLHLVAPVRRAAQALGAKPSR